MIVWSVQSFRVETCDRRRRGTPSHPATQSSSPSSLRATSVRCQGTAPLWRDRYRSISNLERHLHANGARIIKFFLHLSKEQQRKRFLARIDEPEKNWKFNAADVEERKFWKHYMKACEECLSATSTRDSPWYVVPADDKENARLIVPHCP